MLLTQHDPMLTNYVMAMVPSADAQNIARDQNGTVEVDRQIQGRQQLWGLGTENGALPDFGLPEKEGRENKRLWFTDEC